MSMIFPETIFRAQVSHKNLCRDVTRGGKGGTIPPALNHWGRREVPTMSQVLSSRQHICFWKILGSNAGTPNMFLVPGAV